MWLTRCKSQTLGAKGTLSAKLIRARPIFSRISFSSNFISWYNCRRAYQNFHNGFLIVNGPMLLIFHFNCVSPNNDQNQIPE